MKKEQYKGQEGFEIFHRSNPEVYAIYKKLALEMCEQGNTVRSSYLIERVRNEWGKSIPNNTKPYYSRRFVRDYPRYIDMFTFAKIKG